MNDFWRRPGYPDPTVFSSVKIDTPGGCIKNHQPIEWAVNSVTLGGGHPGREQALGGGVKLEDGGGVFGLGLSTYAPQHTS